MIELWERSRLFHLRDFLQDVGKSWLVNGFTLFECSNWQLAAFVCVFFFFFLPTVFQDACQFIEHEVC